MSQTKQARIMIVEDNPTDVMLVRMALEQEGFPVEFIVCPDGEAAIERLCWSELFAAGPDLIILDLNLPKRAGVEVLHAIRGAVCRVKAPVVILSSAPREIIERTMQNAKVAADCYFTKPPRLKEFLQLGKHIRECFQAARPDFAT